MSDKILSKDKLSEFIKSLSSAQKVWSLAGEMPESKYVPLEDGEAKVGECLQSIVPPKNVVFPQTETLFKYMLGKPDMEVPAGVEEMAVVGLRPCDAKAMAIVDSLFAWDVDDDYYQDRREKTTLIGLACNEPGINCFCPSVGGGPASTEGLDVLMSDLGDKYLLRGITEKGEKALAVAGDLLQDAADEDQAAAESAATAAGDKIRRSIETAGIPEGIQGLWENELWKRVSDACLGCGTCTLLCPTCHCFDIQDEVEGFQGRRCRMWDSCMFEEYTLHTSGHNTRPTRRERTRNRINHKYSYYVEKFGKIACVGCGRCTENCPVNIDILNILSQVKEAL